MKEIEKMMNSACIAYSSEKKQKEEDEKKRRTMEQDKEIREAKIKLHSAIWEILSIETDIEKMVYKDIYPGPALYEWVPSVKLGQHELIYVTNRFSATYHCRMTGLTLRGECGAYGS